MEAEWSQSRVLPSAQLAYETCLSAGSIAKWSDNNGAAALSLIGFGDLWHSHNPMKFRYSHFPSTRLWPSSHGVISVVWKTAPLADFLIRAKWVSSVFPKLVGG